MASVAGPTADRGVSPAPSSSALACSDDGSVEIVEEMTETEALAYLDSVEPAWSVVGRLFLRPKPRPPLRVLSWAALDQLATVGYTVVDDVLDAAAVAALRADAGRLRDAGGLRAAADAGGPGFDGAARGDCVAFIDAADDLPPGLAAAAAALKAAAADVAAAVALDAPHTPELQLAIYPAGAEYVRHRDALPLGREREGGRERDALPRQTTRRVTIILYAQDASWTEATHGGALRLWPPATARGACAPLPVDVAPRGGRAVIFMAGAVDHAVLKTAGASDRVAATAWVQ